jgi:hypothetical protein
MNSSKAFQWKISSSVNKSLKEPAKKVKSTVNVNKSITSNEKKTIVPKKS